MLTNPTPPIDLEAAGSITTIRNLTELGIALRELLFGASGGSSTGSILEELRIKETVARFILVRLILLVFSEARLTISSRSNCRNWITISPMSFSRFKSSFQERSSIK